MSVYFKPHAVRSLATSAPILHTASESDTLQDEMRKRGAKSILVVEDNILNLSMCGGVLWIK